MSRFLILLLLAACDAGRDDTPRADPRFAGQILETPVEMPAATLEGADGVPFVLPVGDSGRVTLLFFGYTNCPDICPVHMATLSEAMRFLPLEVTRGVDVLFVTTDPERDTPARLREWLGALHPRFAGLRGTREEVERLERLLGLPVSVVEGDFVAHATQVLAFGLDGVARTAYPFGTRQRDWIRDLPLLVAGERPPDPREP